MKHSAEYEAFTNAVERLMAIPKAEILRRGSRVQKTGGPEPAQAWAEEEGQAFPLGLGPRRSGLNDFSSSCFCPMLPVNSAPSGACRRSAKLPGRTSPLHSYPSCCCGEKPARLCSGRGATP